MASKFINLDNLASFLAKLKTLFTTTEQATDIANTAAGTARTGAVDDVKKLGYQTAADVTKTLDGKGYQTAEQVDTAIAAKGYDTTASVDKKVADAKSELQNSIGSAFHPKGSSAFADLPATGRAVGDVWNVTDAFTTTDDFVEGAGKNYPSGTNIVLVNVTTGEGADATTTPKWDALSGVTDLSGYMLKTDMVAATDADIDGLFA